MVMKCQPTVYVVVLASLQLLPTPHPLVLSHLQHSRTGGAPHTFEAPIASSQAPANNVRHIFLAPTASLHKGGDKLMNHFYEGGGGNRWRAGQGGGVKHGRYVCKL